MSTNKENGITLDDLANMVAKGFESVDKRFESMEERFESMEGKLGSMEKRMATKEDLARLEHRVEEIHDIVTVLAEGEIPDLQRRVRILERVVKVSK